ncbi:hypothetical protein [Trichocoleus sp. FACHB-46]|nr:hypothetical protein [Trichocoleus sp. FACHB-46]
MIIDLEQPLTEQESVKELLNLSEGKVGRLGLDQLLEIAKVAIKNELVACGSSADELVGLRLEFHCFGESDEGLRETYVLEWGQKNQQKEDNPHQLEKTESEKLQSANKPSLPPMEYIHKLSERLNSETRERARLAGTTISFRTSSDTGVQYPCVDGGNNKYYLKLIENGEDKGWYIRLGKKVECNPDDLTNIPTE